METETLGHAIRAALLGFSERERVSTWDYRAGRVLWNTVFSSKLLFVAVLGSLLLFSVSLGWLFAKKRSFTQKDTLCVFIYMVVTIFLLEGVQKTAKIDVKLDRTYEAEVKVPRSRLFFWESGKREWCEEEMDRVLEKKEEEMKMGETASRAYRKIVRGMVMRKRARNSILDREKERNQKELGNSNGETEIARYGGRRGGGRLEPAETRIISQKLRSARPRTTEYCIFEGEQRPCAKKGCVYLPKHEFREASAELAYIDKVNAEYRQIQEKMESERKEYTHISVGLMKSFKQMSKLSVFITDELSGLGIDTQKIERSIKKLVEKYDQIFEKSAEMGNTRIFAKKDSVCVRVTDAEGGFPPVLPVLSPGGARVQKKRYIVTEERRIEEVGGGAESAEAKEPGGEARGGPGAEAPSILRGFLVQPSLVKSSDLSDRNKNFPGESFEKRANLKNIAKNQLGDLLKVKSNAAYLPVVQTKTSADNAFFWTLSSSLFWAEILLFFQVFLSLALIISVVFDKKPLYLGFYFCISLSFLLCLLLGMYSFTYATALSSLCRSGLSCHSRTDSHTVPKKISELIDLPHLVLNRAINQSEMKINRQISNLIKTNTTEEIESIDQQLDRLFKIREDFSFILTENLHKSLVNKNQYYSYAQDMKNALNSLKKLDREVRETKWTETFKNLSQVSVLLREGPKGEELKKRRALMGLAGSSLVPPQNTCTGKEVSICALQERFDSLFVGFFFFSVILPVLIAV